MINIEQKPHVAMLQMTGQGLAQASAIVSKINHIDIDFKIMSHGMIGIDYIHQLFDQYEPEVVVISQYLQGDIHGHALFIMNAEKAMQLMRCLLKENARLRELTEMEEEALLELGNIIINSCLRNYLKLYQGSLNTQLPNLERDHFVQILDEYREEIPDESLFHTEIQINLLDKHFTAYLMWTQKR